MLHSRREAIKIMCSGAAVMSAPSLAKSKSSETGGKELPIALQLYTVRDACKKLGFDKAVTEVAKMGYRGVEFAGYYNYTKNPAGLKKLLDKCELKAAGTHTGIESLRGNALKKTIEFNKAIGNKYLIVPGMRHKTREQWEGVAKEMSEIAAKLKEQGMFTGYHAHLHDFEKIDGKTKWEIFFDAGCKDLVMQIDTGNCRHGNGDPYAMIEKYPGQSKTVHLKESTGNSPGGAIGTGDTDWKKIITLCQTVGETEWYIVEQDVGRIDDSMSMARDSINALKKIYSSM